MAKNETKFLRPVKLEKDSAVLAVISDFADYNPTRPELTLAKLQAADAEYKAAEVEFVRIRGQFEAARDALVARQWARHNLLLGAKQQVIAQYGDDSDEKQAIGLTKKSEHAKPKRRAKTV